jgi:NADH:ubiquinone oxidoreductase subunit 5 (subunit L)/multisubunit Na+/H+ antiporter MnhA subunit
MLLFIVFTPLINFLIFACFSSFVHRTQLARFAIVSMLFLLSTLILRAPAVIAGQTDSASLGA